MLHKPLAVAALLAASCGAGVVSAETPPPSPLRLAEVVQRALANNPGFAAARFERRFCHLDHTCPPSADMIVRYSPSL